MLPNWRGSNGRSSCDKCVHVRSTVLRCSEMHPMQLMPKLSAKKRFNRLYSAGMHNCEGLGDLSVDLDSVGYCVRKGN